MPDNHVANVPAVKNADPPVRPTSSTADLNLLRRWFASHTKEQCVEMLATCIYTGLPPYVPEREVILLVQPKAPRGRPAGRNIESVVQLVTTALEAHYPNSPDDFSLATLAAETGIALVTLTKLRRQAEYLPPHLQSYFLNIPDRKQHHLLPTLWRGILDIHNYLLMLQEPRFLLPLYKLHARLWGANAFMLSSRMLGDASARKVERSELERLFHPTFAHYRQMAGWPPLEAPGTHEGIGCHEGCYIVEAFLRGTKFKTVGDVCALLARHAPAGFPLRVGDTTKLTACVQTRDVYSQLLPATLTQATFPGSHVEDLPYEEHS